MSRPPVGRYGYLPHKPSKQFGDERACHVCAKPLSRYNPEKTCRRHTRYKELNWGERENGRK